MAYIFLSYSKDDRTVATKLAAELHEQEGWEVFFDRDIKAGADWSREVQRQLRDARCVLVLWSNSSRKSLWVQGEAANAYERDLYFPVRIDESEPPRLFQHVQVLSIAQWARQEDASELNVLRAAIASRIGELPMYGNLEQVAEGEPVTETHLHLIHSCWRVDKPTPFGIMPYQIHLIVYGHASALDRIVRVDYRLPGYPKGHECQTVDLRERLFELKELANGFCIAQAEIHLRLQPPGHSSILRLSRFVNLSESGPRLDDFIHRRSVK